MRFWALNFVCVICRILIVVYSSKLVLAERIKLGRRGILDGAGPGIFYPNFNRQRPPCFNNPRPPYFNDADASLDISSDLAEYFAKFRSPKGFSFQEGSDVRPVHLRDHLPRSYTSRSRIRGLNGKPATFLDSPWQYGTEVLKESQSYVPYVSQRISKYVRYKWDISCERSIIKSTFCSHDLNKLLKGMGFTFAERSPWIRCFFTSKMNRAYVLDASWNESDPSVLILGQSGIPELESFAAIPPVAHIIGKLIVGKIQGVDLMKTLMLIVTQNTQDRASVRLFYDIYKSTPRRNYVYFIKPGLTHDIHSSATYQALAGSTNGRLVYYMLLENARGFGNLQPFAVVSAYSPETLRPTALVWMLGSTHRLNSYRPPDKSIRVITKLSKERDWSSNRRTRDNPQYKSTAKDWNAKIFERPRTTRKESEKENLKDPWKKDFQDPWTKDFQDPQKKGFQNPQKKGWRDSRRKGVRLPGKGGLEPPGRRRLKNPAKISLWDLAHINVKEPREDDWEDLETGDPENLGKKEGRASKKETLEISGKKGIRESVMKILKRPTKKGVERPKGSRGQQSRNLQTSSSRSGVAASGDIEKNKPWKGLKEQRYQRKGELQVPQQQGVQREQPARGLPELPGGDVGWPEDPHDGYRYHRLGKQRSASEVILAKPGFADTQAQRYRGVEPHDLSGGDSAQRDQNQRTGELQTPKEQGVQRKQPAEGLPELPGGDVGWPEDPHDGYRYHRLGEQRPSSAGAVSFTDAQAQHHEELEPYVVSKGDSTQHVQKSQRNEGLQVPREQGVQRVQREQPAHGLPELPGGDVGWPEDPHDGYRYHRPDKQRSFSLPGLAEPGSDA